MGTGRRAPGAGRLVSNRMAFNLLVPSIPRLQPARSVKFSPIFDGSSRYKDLLRGRLAAGGWPREQLARGQSWGARGRRDRWLSPAPCNPSRKHQGPVGGGGTA